MRTLRFATTFEGNLNVCLKAIHDLYASAPPTQRVHPKCRLVLCGNLICSEGWPKHPKTLVYTLLTCERFRREDTCHAYTVNEAMTALFWSRNTIVHGRFLSTVETFEPIHRPTLKMPGVLYCDCATGLKVGSTTTLTGRGIMPQIAFPKIPTRCTWQISGLHSDTLRSFQSGPETLGRYSRTGGGQAPSRFENMGHRWQGATQSRTPDLETPQS